MTPLASESGAQLDVLVEAQRGLTDTEIAEFLVTGVPPDLSQSSHDSLDAPRANDDDVVMGKGDARAYLAGISGLVAGASFSLAQHHNDVYHSDVALKFNPKQPRDPNTGKWVDNIVGELSDGDILKRAQRVQEVMGRVHKTLGTDRTETISPNVWSPERDAIHREIVDDVYRRAASVPNNGRAIIAGGPSGAGKSTTLSGEAHVNASKYLRIDPDDMKVELAKRGLIPEVPGEDDLSPMERSTLVHAESMRMARMLAQRAYADKKNVIWDITMTAFGATKSHMDALRRNGYTQVAAVYVSVPREVSKRRVHKRYADDARAHARGDGLGGRFIPDAVLDDQYDSQGRPWSLTNFNALRDRFDAWMSFSNPHDDQPPKLHNEKGVISHE